MKYKLSNETKTFEGKTLHRIISFKNFIIALNDGRQRKVYVGDYGGWVESEDNLAQIGDCWIFDDAIVCDCGFCGQDAVIEDYALVKDHACVRHNSLVSGKAVIEGNADVLDAIIKDNAIISGDATIGKNSVVSDNAKVCNAVIRGGKISENASIFDNCIVNGIVKGKTVLKDYVFVSGESVIDINSTIFGETRIMNTLIERHSGAILTNYFEIDNEKFLCRINNVKLRDSHKGFNLIPLHYLSASKDKTPTLLVGPGLVSYAFDVSIRDCIIASDFNSFIKCLFPYVYENFSDYLFAENLCEYIKEIFLSDNVSDLFFLADNFINVLKINSEPSITEKLQDNNELISYLSRVYVLTQFVGILVWATSTPESVSAIETIRWDVFLNDLTNIFVLDIKTQKIEGINKDAFAYNLDLLKMIESVCSLPSDWAEKEYRSLKSISEASPSIKLYCLAGEKI